jgi:hypothetical protein
VGVRVQHAIVGAGTAGGVADAGSALAAVESKMFFFEKKNQKTFIRLVRAQSIEAQTNEIFFASFCSQKEDSSFIP